MRACHADLRGPGTATPAHGWRRDDARACEPDGPPRLCFVSEPDRPLTLSAGGERLLPGECAQAPEARGGSLVVEVRDGASGETRRRRVHVARGKELTVTAKANNKLRIVDRRRCQRTPHAPGT